MLLPDFSSALKRHCSDCCLQQQWLKPFYNKSLDQYRIVQLPEFEI